MTRLARFSTRAVLVFLPGLIASTVLGLVPGVAAAQGEPIRTLTAPVQAEPGGRVEEVEIGIYESPVDPPSMAASEADLPPDDLVLGVVINGQAMAWPVRYLALSEVVNDRVGGVPLAPTW